MTKKLPTSSLTSDRSGETTAARLRRNRSGPCVKNWLVIPRHLPNPIWNPFPLTQISLAARKVLLLLNQESKLNLARRRKDQRRQPRLALNRPSPDCHPDRSEAKWRDPAMKHLSLGYGIPALCSGRQENR